MSALDRAKALDVFGRFSHEIAVNRSVDGDAFLDQIEACVEEAPTADLSWDLIEILASETSDIALRQRLFDRIMRLVQPSFERQDLTN